MLRLAQDARLEKNREARPPSEKAVAVVRQHMQKRDYTDLQACGNSSHGELTWPSALKVINHATKLGWHHDGCRPLSRLTSQTDFDSDTDVEVLDAGSGSNFFLTLWPQLCPNAKGIGIEFCPLRGWVCSQSMKDLFDSDSCGSLVNHDAAHLLDDSFILKNLEGFDVLIMNDEAFLPHLVHHMASCLDNCDPNQ